jgi:hypothetical protein
VADGRHDLQLVGIDAAGLTNSSARTTVFTHNASVP